MSKLDTKLLRNAVNALLEYNESKKDAGGNSLLGEYAKAIQAQIQLKESIKKPILKPVRVKIPHSFFDPEGSEEHSICLFVRSEDKADVETYLKANPRAIPGLNIKESHGTVLSLDDVKKLYKNFKELKKLQSSYSHFICDARIMSHLYGKLGKTFGSRNNFPVPIDYKSLEQLPRSVKKAVDSTYTRLNGQNLMIRVGLTGTLLTHAQIVANITEGLDFLIAKLKNQWKDVKGIYLKCSDSAALPIYAKNYSEQMKFVKEAAADSDEEDASSNKSKTKNGKKRKGGSEKEAPTSNKKAKSGKEAKEDKEEKVESRKSLKEIAPMAVSEKVKAAALGAVSKSKGKKKIESNEEASIKTTKTRTSSRTVGKSTAVKDTKKIEKSDKSPIKAVDKVKPKGMVLKRKKK